MKIDYVFPCVFNDDPEWQKTYIEEMKKNGQLPILDHPRFRSFNIEKYILRSIEKYASWIDKVFIILSSESQIRDWMNTDKIRIIYHKEFIPEEFLPTFNSSTIEMFLHNIPDLSEYFIYGNDDMFFCNNVEISDFFENGLPCLGYVKDEFKKVETPYFRRCFNSMKLACDTLGDKDWIENQYMYYANHMCEPKLKSTDKMLYENNKDLIHSRITKFRNQGNFIQYTGSYWQIVSNKYVYKNIPHIYLDMQDKNIDDICNFIDNKIHNYKMFCVNDNVIRSTEEGNKKIINTFEKLFTEKSKYEN